MSRLLSIEDALAAILGRVQPLGEERVAVGPDLVGRVIAVDAAARIDLPPFPSSAMDGFAVRAADTPGELPVVFRVAAGRPAQGRLAAGEAMGIATGGVVPDGADAVIPIEYVVDNDNSVEISEPVELGANVRPPGSDVEAGAVVVPRRTVLGPTQVGALAAAGIGEVACSRRPVAAVVVTGTELRRPGEKLEPGQIYESNGAMLESQLRTVGATVGASPAHAVDEEGEHHAALRTALEAADVVLTTGGVSVGPHDLVRGVSDELGVEEVFWGVAVKPGKPLFFGVRDRTLVFGLPGNPVSALVGFELFVRPALRALQGAAEPGPRLETGVLGAAARRNVDRDQFLRGNRVETDGLPQVVPLRGQESHMIARAASANVLVHVPSGEGTLEVGTTVRFLPLG